MTRTSVQVAVGIVALLAVVAITGGVVVFSENGDSTPERTLSANWVSDTGRNVTGNHHVAVGGTVGNESFVFAPISGEARQNASGHDHRHDHNGGDSGSTAASGCGLVALEGTSGEVRWTYDVPPEHCTIHSIADPTLADVDDDGVREVLATSTEETVVAYDPHTGEVEFRHNLSAYGYTRPLVGDFTGDGTPEVVVVDVHGTVFVVAPDGEAIWSRKLPADYVWGQPHLADFDGDDSPELAVALGNGQLVLLEGDGTTAWNRSVGSGDSVTWFTTGQADDDRPVELVTATSGGNVSVFDGDGSRVWRENFGAYAAVHGVGDGDEDGTPEVYVTARDGNLRAVEAPSGEVEWSTSLTTVNVQMTPPPILGDVDDDGNSEVVAASNDGTVTVVDPASGEILATYGRDVPIWTNPSLADVDADGAPEILVTYGDGRVVALSYERA